MLNYAFLTLSYDSNLLFEWILAQPVSFEWIYYAYLYFDTYSDVQTPKIIVFKCLVYIGSTKGLNEEGQSC
ncbi:hypothetical protein Hdeb2414_s0026g00673821 [Helianthus debilis subsp. tardiflorus]